MCISILKKLRIVFLFGAGMSLSISGYSQNLSVKNVVGAATKSVIHSPQNMAAGISISNLDGVFITFGQKDEFYIAWFEQSLACELYYATKPGLGKSDNYPNKIDKTGLGELLFEDEFKNLNIGIYYCILRNVDDPAVTSMEFVIYVQPQAPVRMFEPEGSVTITNSPPEFRWQPINRVPYYYVLLSQGEIEIIEDENGDIESIEGLNIIWQAFTENASIRYGDSDLSGTWPDANTPLLIPGIEYNWVVFSAFAPDLRFVAWELFPLSMSSFTVDRKTFAQNPDILLPQENDFVTDDEIQFSWRSVPGAVRYHVYLQQILKNEDIGDGTILFWQQTTIDTSAIFHAKKFLAYENCKVRVIAENAASIAVSPERNFIYNSESGFLRLQTQDQGTSAMLPYTSIKISNPSGTSSPFPFFSGDDGKLTIDLPSGNYRAHGFTQGYVPDFVDFTISENDTTVVPFFFTPANFLLTGRVLDASTQSPVPFAQIKLPNGENYKTDGAGNLTLSSTTAINQITAHALAYSTQVISINAAYENGLASIGDIFLPPAGSKITGKLTDSNGQALTGGTFLFKNENTEYTRKFNQSSQFEYALESGEWDIRVTNPGYYSIPAETKLTLSDGETRPLFLSFSQASILNGQVTKDGDLIGTGIVRAVNQNSGEILETTINNYGSFRFDLQAGTWEVEVSATGVGFKKEIVEIAENSVKNITFSLAQATFIAGTVYNAANNAPLPDVRIFEVPTNELLAVTDAQGAYQFIAVPNKSYQLSANLTGYISSTATVTAVDGNVTMQAFYLQQESTMIRGRILHNSAPVADAEIFIAELNISTRSDADGLFAVNVSPGTYSLTVTAGCLDPQTRSVVVSSTTGVDLEIVLQGIVSVVSGHIFDEDGLPLAEANILAAGTSSYSARSDSLGFYSMCLDADTYFLLISRIGFLTQDTTFSIAENDTLKNVNFYLENNFAHLNGIIKTGDGQPVPDIQLIFSNPWQQLVSSSDKDGFFAFNDLYPGTGILIVRSTNYYAAPQSVELVGQQTKSLDITVTRNDGFISGFVLNQKSGAAISEAQVTAQIVNGSQIFQTSSSATGSFLLDNLPSVADIRFKLKAEKDGFALVQGADSVPAFTVGIELGMLSKTSTISGQVFDKESQLPLAGIQINLQALSENYETHTFSGSDGSYHFDNLVESFVYTLSVNNENFGYAAWQIAAPAQDINFDLNRIYSYARGSAIFLDSQMAFRNATFIFTSLDGQGKSDTVAVNSDGQFFIKLWPGQYLVRVEAPLYFGAPSNANYTFLRNDTTDVGIYTLEKQELSQLQIDGPSTLQNHFAGAQFYLSAFDSLNRSISSIPSIAWFVDLGADTAAFNQSGYLSIDPGFIGELNISIFDSVTHMSAAKRVDVVAQVDSLTDFFYFGREKQSLTVEPGTFEESTTISFSAQNLSPVQNVERNFRAINPVVKIIPDNVVFNKPAVFSLPPPTLPVWGKLGILRWDNLLSAWETEEELTFTRLTGTDDRISRDIIRGGDYVLIEVSEALKILDLTVQPNPFSPEQTNDFGENGVALSFILTSNKVALPLVTAKIYNMSGDLVVILANQKPTAKGRQHFSWNGLAVDGRMARNGRYILHFTVEDGRDKQEVIKSIVLIQ
ncbi:MAG: DUF1416 domain-containing protein [Calditrichaeota bacterium]|nr:MAG: DUF1416 domain-containing protein [Calditrichota bacterium]